MQSQILVDLGFLLPNLAEVLMLTKQSDLCGEPDAAYELSLPGENKSPAYTAPESTTRPVRRQQQHKTLGMQERIYSMVITAFHSLLHWGLKWPFRGFLCLFLSFLPKNKGGGWHPLCCERQLLLLHIQHTHSRAVSNLLGFAISSPLNPSVSWGALEQS